MSSWKGRQGIHWVVRKPDARFLRAVLVDSNYWKSQVYDSLRVPLTHPIALRWYQEGQSYHQMLADHCCSERAVRVESRGRKIDEWDLKPSRPDNHLWDCVVGNTVAGSICGLRRKGQVVLRPQPKKKRTIKL